MKFNTAKKKLRKIAAGRYHVIHRAVTTYRGAEQYECRLYIDGHDHFIAETFEEAFVKLGEGVK